jgi:hypothetical protein
MAAMRRHLRLSFPPIETAAIDEAVLRLSLALAAS